MVPKFLNQLVILSFVVSDLVKLELIALSECWGRVINNKHEVSQRSSYVFNFGNADILRL